MWFRNSLTGSKLMVPMSRIPSVLDLAQQEGILEFQVLTDADISEMKHRIQVPLMDSNLGVLLAVVKEIQSAPRS